MAAAPGDADREAEAGDVARGGFARRLGGAAVLGITGAGFPISQLAIARFGQAGAVTVEGILLAMLAADLWSLAGHGTRRRPVGERALLVAEAVAACGAVAASTWLLRDPEVTAARQKNWAVSRAELARRIAIGALFGMRSTRLRYLVALPDTTKGRP
jgi:hypothetical protein